MKILKDLLAAYRDHDCFNLAANISFFAILSLIPLLMITMSVAGYVLGGSAELFSNIVSAVTSVLPSGQDELTANLNGIVRVRSGFGWVGIVFLLFIASLLFSSIEHALDRIFQSVKKRNFFHSRALSILLVFGFVFVMFMPTLVGVFQSALVNFNVSIPLGDIATNRYFFAALMIISFVAAVMIIPNHDVKFRFALAGGLFFAAGIAIAKFVFRWYIFHSFDRYNLIYGSLTVLVVTIIWIYYLINILLISSELVAVLQRRYFKCPNNGANGEPA